MTTSPLSSRQIIGLDDSHLQALPCGNRLIAEVAQAFAQLQHSAVKAGFDLAIASSYRSFERQLLIFNGKVCGERPVHDDQGFPLEVGKLPAPEKLQAILRFSAIPGTSRHHWGTDLDVYDRAAMPDGYSLQLTPSEVARGGMFDALHCWLDEQMAKGQAYGFYRPYGLDRGGVAPERWHLSYAPLAKHCEDGLDIGLLKRCWRDRGLLLQDEIEADLQKILARYVVLPGAASCEE